MSVDEYCAVENTLFVDFAELYFDILLQNVFLAVLKCSLGILFELIFVRQATDSLDNKDNVATLLVHTNLEPRTIQYELYDTSQLLFIL